MEKMEEMLKDKPKGGMVIMIIGGSMPPKLQQEYEQEPEGSKEESCDMETCPHCGQPMPKE